MIIARSLAPVTDDVPILSKCWINLPSFIDGGLRPGDPEESVESMCVEVADKRLARNLVLAELP